MVLVYSVNDKIPNIGKNCFLAPNATVIGDVTIGDNCSIWFGTVIRGDVNSIIIGENTNIQDNTVVHCNTTKSTSIGNNVTIGHGVLIHACDIHDEALIGNKSVVHDNAIVGKRSLIAPGCVVTDRTIVDPEVLITGIPGKFKRKLDEQDFKKMSDNNKRYLKLKSGYLDNFKQIDL